MHPGLLAFSTGQERAPSETTIGILHRQAFAPSRGATPQLRHFDRIDLERDRQPCFLGGLNRNVTKQKLDLL
jgi:hypothetical protein